MCYDVLFVYKSEMRLRTVYYFEEGDSTSRMVPFMPGSVQAFSTLYRHFVPNVGFSYQEIFAGHGNIN